MTHFKSQLGGELVSNLVVETPGTAIWRARGAIEGAYYGLRRRASAVARQARRRGSE